MRIDDYLDIDVNRRLNASHIKLLVIFFNNFSFLKKKKKKHFLKFLVRYIPFRYFFKMTAIVICRYIHCDSCLLYKIIFFFASHPWTNKKNDKIKKI